MIRVLREYRSFDRGVQVLLLNQLGIYLGFFMLLPYLSLYLSATLGLAGWAVGLILGARNFAQQGMFLIGGTITDRLGYRIPVIAGCALRTAGFTLLGIVSTVPALLLAAVVTGLAGALFTPAVRVGLARESGPRRIEAFALSNIVYRIGAFAGPLLGLALIALSFRIACLSSALVFALLTLMQIRTLPAEHIEASRGRVLHDVREVGSNPKLILFSLAMVGAYVLSFQIYLALPIEARLIAGANGALLVALLFVLSATLALTSQFRITDWCRHKFGPFRSLPVGVTLLTMAFLPPALPPTILGRTFDYVPLLVSCALLALGTIIVFPFEMDTIIVLSRNRLVATHYGLYSTIVGIGILVGNLFTGTVLSWARTADLPTLPWLGLALVGAICALGLRLQNIAQSEPDPC